MLTFTYNNILTSNYTVHGLYIYMLSWLLILDSCR